ncbi:MAG: SDR family NAD(P)-dependent oxidoreductase, partial [Alphaproteobacteria bacterium]
AATMQAHGEGGSIIFTGATASLRARPPFVGFASAKAAERALAHGMAREFGKDGIHVANVIVDGIIGGDKVRSNFPDFFEALGEDGVLNINDMADNYWMLHSQPRSTWTLELDLRPYKENF